MPRVFSSSAFEIDFSLFDINIGDPVLIVIEQNEGCHTKRLNPEVLLPISTFEVSVINITESGKLTWTTTDEQGKLPFIEQFRWNKWVNAGVVDGKGSTGPNNYEYEIIPHSGENKVRVVQIDH